MVSLARGSLQYGTYFWLAILAIPSDLPYWYGYLDTLCTVPTTWQLVSMQDSAGRHSHGSWLGLRVHNARFAAFSRYVYTGNYYITIMIIVKGTSCVRTVCRCFGSIHWQYTGYSTQVLCFHFEFECIQNPYYRCSQYPVWWGTVADKTKRNEGWRLKGGNAIIRNPKVEGIPNTKE